jgi:(p)ppGpp synthase/HD superfamily hydrolase
MQNALEIAIALACESHRGQIDKAGQPYILHPLRLMLACDSTPERIVAVLHDVVEDSSVTLDQLRDLGFDSSIVCAIDCLTRRHDESYDAFIDRIASNTLATRVKLRDLRDNLDLSRLSSLSDEDLQRICKYHRALMRLLAANVP